MRYNPWDRDGDEDEDSDNWDVNLQNQTNCSLCDWVGIGWITL